MMGGSVFSLEAPVSCSEPWMDACDWPVSVTVTLETERGFQVPAHVPSCSVASASCGSPFEKLATTEPAVKGWPQSSPPDVSSDPGHPAGTAKSDPSDVDTRPSL